jgi:hypothetical protein
MCGHGKTCSQIKVVDISRWALAHGSEEYEKYERSEKYEESFVTSLTISR